jgi:hypothetical protein
MIEYARIDMCKLGYSELFDLKRKHKDDFAKVIIDGANQVVSVDCYDDPLVYIPIKEFRRVLRREIKSSRERQGSVYRRLLWAEALLTQLVKTDEARRGQLFVVMFGH